MLRRNAFPHRKLEVPVASGRDIADFWPTVPFIEAGIGTEIFAHREKFEVSRGSSSFRRSPVPMADANRC